MKYEKYSFHFLVRFQACQPVRAESRGAERKKMKIMNTEQAKYRMERKKQKKTD